MYNYHRSVSRKLLFFWTIAPENCSICALFLGTLLSQNNLFQKNEDESELLITPEWVSIYDILEKKIPIDRDQVGLEKLLLKMINETICLETHLDIET